MLLVNVFFKAVKAAALALAVCVLALGCGGGGKDDDNPLKVQQPSTPTVDGDLVGDWLVYDGVNEKGYISLQRNGKLSEGIFRKVDGFWIEGFKDGSASWGVVRSRGEFYIISAVWTDTMRYVLSDGVFTVTACYENGNRNSICPESDLTRVNLTNYRSNLGTVRANDSSLYITTAQSDLMWRFQNNTSEAIDFDAVYFDKEGERYVGNISNGMWYTDGSTLVLLEVAYNCGYRADDCEATVLNTYELSYRVTPNAGGAPTRLMLSGGSGSEDVWLPMSFDNRSKSRQGAAAVKRADSPLAKLTGRR